MQKIQRIYPLQSDHPDSRELDYSIFNQNGQTIQKGSIDPGASIDISDQPIGLYLLKLFDDKRLVGSFKILKK